MPELPEVETTVRDLKFIVGFSIINIKLNRNNLRYPIPKNKITLTKNGYDLIDCQVPSAHLKSLGAEEISREEFVKYLV